MDNIQLKTPEEAVAWAQFVVQVCCFVTSTTHQEHGREVALQTATLLDAWVCRTEQHIKRLMEGTK